MKPFIQIMIFYVHQQRFFTVAYRELKRVCNDLRLLLSLLF